MGIRKENTLCFVRDAKSRLYARCRDKEESGKTLAVSASLFVEYIFYIFFPTRVK